MVTSVGYFCSGGYTETGGIQVFLQKINPALNWKRCFPAVDKPLPRRGRENSTPIRSHNGVTGEKLVEAMLEQLKKYGFDCDYLLLIDDADCRFNRESDVEQAVSRHVNHLQAQIDEVLQRHVPLLFLWAAPEVETWFVADPTKSFARVYPKTAAHALIQYINQKVLGSEYRHRIESYGGLPTNGACSVKLSSQIQAAFAAPELQPTLAELPSLHYSKKSHGAAMLKQIDPRAVARRCRTYFERTYRELHQLHER